LKRAVRVLCFVLIFAVVLFLGGDSAPGAVEAARGERPPPIQVGASVNSTSSNSSCCAITITMTGMVGDPGDLSCRG
jgi:hypothetical protein